MRRSSEARTLLQELQEDARLLGSLPRNQLPVEFAEQVQAKLPKRTLKVAAFSTKSERRYPWRYIGAVAAAATLLLAVSIAFWQKTKQPIEVDPSVPDSPGFVEARANPSQRWLRSANPTTATSGKNQGTGYRYAWHGQ